MSTFCNWGTKLIPFFYHWEIKLMSISFEEYNDAALHLLGTVDVLYHFGTKLISTWSFNDQNGDTLLSKPTKRFIGGCT